MCSSDLKHHSKKIEEAGSSTAKLGGNASNVASNPLLTQSNWHRFHTDFWFLRATYASCFWRLLISISVLGSWMSSCIVDFHFPPHDRIHYLSSPPVVLWQVRQVDFTVDAENSKRKYTLSCIEGHERTDPQWKCAECNSYSHVHGVHDHTCATCGFVPKEFLPIEYRNGIDINPRFESVISKKHERKYFTTEDLDYLDHNFATLFQEIREAKMQPLDRTRLILWLLFYMPLCNKKTPGFWKNTNESEDPSAFWYVVFCAVNKRQEIGNLCTLQLLNLPLLITFPNWMIVVEYCVRMDDRDTIIIVNWFRHLGTEMSTLY